MAERIEIKGTDIDLSQAGIVKISSPSLVNGLIKSQTSTLDLVEAQLATLDINMLSLDNQGRVVIADQNFHDQIKAKLDALTAIEKTLNIGCGAGC
jgi:hypothetical protein